MALEQEEGHRLFVLGAGFSAPAGLPTGTELWREVLRWGSREEVFTRDLRKYLQYKRKADGSDIPPEGVDFEDFLGFLDIEHHMELLGSDTWSNDGNKGQVLVKCLIGEILSERMPSAIPDLYFGFAGRLQRTDIVLTFNYDVLLERSLRAVGVPFRLFPNRYSSWTGDSGVVDEWESREVVVLKLHGSIDWFDRAYYTKHERLREKQGLTGPPPGFSIFSPVYDYGVQKLLEGEQPPDDPLKSIYRIERIEALYDEHSLFLTPPCLLTPSTNKLVYSDRYRTFWRGMGGAGLFCLGLAVIGYSLPPHDSYARQILYGIVKNYESRFVERECSILGWRQAPIVLVDRRQGAAQTEELMHRYRFVDSDRAVVILDGFSQASLDAIFN